MKNDVNTGVQVEIRKKRQDYQTEEAFKALRTNLQFCGREKKAVAITSCTPNEGKSTVSLLLAISLAESGKRTLLIDADMRKSVLMGATRTARRGLLGLAHYLSGQSELQETVCRTDVPGLSLVYSGPFPPNPAELLGGGRFQTMIRQFREQYDFILVDTPPLGSVIDCAVVSESCDGVILVLESGAISWKFAKSVKEQLDRSGCPVLGAVLNKVDLNQRGYGRYYGKYYGQYGEQAVSNHEE